MRCKSEETMEQIKNAVEEFYFSHYRSPSIGELAAEVGYAKSTVHSYLWEMDRRGLLSYNGKTAETAVTRKANAEVVLTPVLGGISCGQPEYAEEDFEAYVALPTALFGSGEFFLLRARGYSMVEAGIEPGRNPRAEVAPYGRGTQKDDAGLLLFHNRNDGLSIRFGGVKFQILVIHNQNPVSPVGNQFLGFAGNIVTQQDGAYFLTQSIGQIARFPQQFKGYTLNFAFPLFGKDKYIFIS